jgi:hypothetical protein
MTEVASGVILIVLKMRRFAILPGDMCSDLPMTFRTSHAAPLIETKSLLKRNLEPFALHR